MPMNWIHAAVIGPIDEHRRARRQAAVEETWNVVAPEGT